MMAGRFSVVGEVIDDKDKAPIFVLHMGLYRA
jgi:hypothetical protein